MPGFLRSLANAVYARITAPTARTATYAGTAFDTIDYDGTIKVVIDVSSVTGTSPTYDFFISTSDTSGGTYTAITGATASQITASGVREINVDASGGSLATTCRRFIKVNATVGGTTPSALVGEGAVGIKKYQP